MQYLRVRNFERFQHYKDRRPPWIKLYRDLWSDPNFFELSETNRYFLLGIFVIASQNDNKIPNKEKWLQRELATTKSLPIAQLINLKWLEIVEEPAAKTLPVGEQDASKMLPLPRERDRSTETEGEGEREIQRETLSLLHSPNIQNPSVLKQKNANGSKPNSEDQNGNEKPDFRKLWGPVEGFIRKQVVEEAFNQFYRGIRIVGLTSNFVELAVPQAFIEARGPSAARDLEAKILEAKTGLLRGRMVKIISIEKFIEQELT